MFDVRGQGWKHGADATKTKKRSQDKGPKARTETVLG